MPDRYLTLTEWEYPKPDALTVEDLQRAGMACGVMETMAFGRGESVAGASWQALGRRFRRALDALGNGGADHA